MNSPAFSPTAGLACGTGPPFGLQGASRECWPPPTSIPCSVVTTKNVPEQHCMSPAGGHTALKGQTSFSVLWGLGFSSLALTLDILQAAILLKHSPFICAHPTRLFIWERSHSWADGPCCGPGCQLAPARCGWRLRACEAPCSWGSAWASVGVVKSGLLVSWELLGWPQFNTRLRLAWGLPFSAESHCQVTFESLNYEYPSRATDLCECVPVTGR